MNAYDIIANCCEKAGYPLSHEQKILVSGAIFVLANEAIQKEREACAKVADGWPDYDVQGLAEAIRERGRK